ncbi:class I SAM-dependent methyltransferase [Prauserella rugosa]|uniref:Ubiquinone/menaquinone biosynthesis C-methylase UbiE n=1 Tax=Prauserella rugosa TaxID=43354 RepID=A0A660CIA5_9PSEU|nr:class I SAM-dependent methyltransferase [Prauserella rugosa]KMS91985.1 ubiquinone biosynthesis methyltransferase UbiE [Streptomyces regensis]TWH21309.1 ubiquinone/menaquinone biosynthesis C-methylase UbiE [Prauserella rugosa]
MTSDNARWQRYWDKHSGDYDRQMALWERRLFADSRAWAASRARGEVVEVAVGTGLNLPWYPHGTRLTGVDISAGMLERARTRAAELGTAVELRQAGADDLPFADASFDTAVCTFGLCAIPDEDAALGEMARVLRPGGRLVLVDHVAATSRFVRLAQRLLEAVTVRQAGEHFLRRPYERLGGHGFEVVEHERFGFAGVVERLVAVTPDRSAASETSETSETSPTGQQG